MGLCRTNCYRAYRQETREGLQRPITRTYYYIDFRPTIDAIKYRLYKLTKSIEGTLAPATERKDYYCPQCGSRWTTLEAIDNIDPISGLFRCHRCNHILNEDTQAGKTGAGHEKQSLLMSQLDGMLSLLRRIDDSFVPENDFDTALANAIPVVRNQLTNPINATHAIDPTRGPATVKGQAAQAQHIEISLIENTSTQAAVDAAAEAARKAELAAQNVLPVWHTQSTVAGEHSTAASNVPHRPSQSLGTDAKAEDEDAKPSLTTEAAENDELAAYYAAMAAEAREAERLEAEEEEEEDDSSPANENDEDEDDDDEEDFEDVVDANTPLPSGTNGIESKNGIKPISTSLGHSSGTSSGTQTPLIEPSETKPLSLKRASQEQEELGAYSKKVKLDPGDEDSEEDEDGVEFEDV